MKTIVSLIIPVYNADKTLKRCINSIQNQTFGEWEMILVDDGSEDDSAYICDRYAVADRRIRVFHQENRGVSCARNVGIYAAKGEFLMFIDSDDTVGASYLQDYVTAIRRMEADVVTGGYTLIESDGSFSTYCMEKSGIFGNEIWEEICREQKPFGYLWNKIFRNDIIRRQHLRLREDMYSQEDFDFCLSYFEKCGRFGIIQNVEYQYYYAEGKRIPPVWNFLENQLKLYNIVRNKGRLSTESAREMSERITLLIYTFFYDSEKQNTLREAIERLDDVENLKNYLQGIIVRDEKSFICYQYLKKRYRFICRYFKYRRILRNMIRKFR